jgi:cell division protein FtsN
MAQKDYVARGRSNNSKKKPTPPPPKASLPWLRIVITLTLVTGFSYFLWSIKGSVPEKLPDSPNSSAISTANSAKQAPSKKNTLPDIPQEEWEFIRSLPEYTVEIEQKQQAQPIVRRLMQCGSFRKEAQAQELRANIAFQGLEAQVKASAGTSGVWYRVILGPYDSKRTAEKDRHTLQRAKINGCKIWNWNL